MLLFKFRLEFVVISNDAIMDHCNATSMIKVRVSIYVSLVSVSGPASVTNTNVVVVLGRAMDTDSLNAVTTETIRACKLGQLPFGFTLIVFCDRNDAARVISSRFQDLEALNTDWASLWSITEVSHDTAALVLLRLTHLFIEPVASQKHRNTLR